MAKERNGQRRERAFVPIRAEQEEIERQRQRLRAEGEERAEQPTSSATAKLSSRDRRSSGDRAAQRAEIE